MGYDELSAQARVLALYHDGKPAQELKAGDEGVVVLDVSPFYAESGGQVGDQGRLQGQGLRFAVSDTQKIQAAVWGHHGRVEEGSLKVGDTVQAVLRSEERRVGKECRSRWSPYH